MNGECLDRKLSIHVRIRIHKIADHSSLAYRNNSVSQSSFQSHVHRREWQHFTRSRSRQVCFFEYLSLTSYAWKRIDFRSFQHVSRRVPTFVHDFQRLIVSVELEVIETQISRLLKSTRRDEESRKSTSFFERCLGSRCGSYWIVAPVALSGLGLSSTLFTAALVSTTTGAGNCMLHRLPRSPLLSTTYFLYAFDTLRAISLPSPSRLIRRGCRLTPHNTNSLDLNDDLVACGCSTSPLAMTV